MLVLVDAFGGDKAPLEVLKGCILSLSENPGIDVALVGNEEKINKCAKENGLDISQLKIRHAPSVIAICDEPTLIRTKKKDSSMAVGMKMLADGEGDAVPDPG